MKDTFSTILETPFRLRQQVIKMSAIFLSLISGQFSTQWIVSRCRPAQHKKHANAEEDRR